MNRVVITGAGTVNPLAHDVAGTFEALANGRGAIGALKLQDVDRLSIKIGAQVTEWHPELHFDPKTLALLDRSVQFALVSARQAVAQSGLLFDGNLADQSGVILGTAGGGLNTTDETYRSVYADGKNRTHPFVVPKLMHSSGASHISMAFNLRGPSFVVSSACASSNHAMGLAFQMVRSGSAPVILTGGAEATLCFGGMKAWEGLRVMSPDGCRPFSLNRNGMVQGEGAAIFVFEDMTHAHARGADILAEVVGFGMSSDASDIVMPSTDGAARAIELAIKDAELNLADIGYVNAHGTGTKANDLSETAAIKRAFGPNAAEIMISSTKAMHGHLIGAAGAIEMLACLLAVQRGIIAPTIGYQEPDPNCDLNVVPNEAREARVLAVLSNAFAFGGMNAVMALKRV